MNLKLSFPHPLILLLGFIFVAALFTHILPAGQFDRTYDEASGREVVVPGTFKEVEPSPIGFLEVFVKIPEGIVGRADIMVLILLIGGAFLVTDRTGAFNEGLGALIYRFRNARYLVLIFVGIAFTIGGAAENLQEEIVAMIPILLLLVQRLGYQKVVAIGISIGCAIIGASFSPINPFQVMIAQLIAEVPVFSGALFRIVFLVLAVGMWLTWMIVKGKEQLTSEASSIENIELNNNQMSWRSGLILFLLALCFGLLIYGILNWGWSYNEMSGLFLGYGLLAGFIGRLGLEGTAKGFVSGFSEMAFVAVVVGLAGSISLVLQEGKVIDSIVVALFTPLQTLPLAFTGIGMVLGHTLLHLPVSSVSGQAALTMPIVAPLADLLGMSRQVMVLCYQYGAGIADMFVPTNGALLAIIVAAKISYRDWIKFIWKPTLILYVIGISAVLIGLFIGI